MRREFFEDRVKKKEIVVVVVVVVVQCKKETLTALVASTGRVAACYTRTPYTQHRYGLAQTNHVVPR